MALTIDDLKPKYFTVTVRGVELTCKPLRLEHALTVAAVGETFSNPKSATAEEIKSAQKTVDELFAALIPELEGVELDAGATLELIDQMMKQIEPSDNKELKKHNVKFNKDPKV